MNKQAVSYVLMNSRRKAILSPGDVSIMLTDVPVASERIAKLFDINLEADYAIKFLDWAADNGWYRDGKRNSWWKIIDHKESKTTAGLWVLFLESLRVTNKPLHKVNIDTKPDEYYNQLTKYNKWSKKKW